MINRGSEWGKWDLHIHSPFSILNNGFGNDWDSYVLQLFQKAINNQIKAIGITDYFSIDGYKKLMIEYVLNNNKMSQMFSPSEIEQINQILILPNIEFRLNKFVGTNRINFHVLFSNEVSIENIEENFLHELDFIYDSAPQTEDEKRKLKTKNLAELGKKLKEQHVPFRDRSDLMIGMMNAVVDDEQITKLLQNKASIFKDNFFVLVPCDEDLSKVHWNGQDHQARKLLIQKSDILIATNPNTIKWALGEFNDSVQDFVNEYKSIKPCIGGSDAHNFEELFTKNIDRSVWIKAASTFEGLRQIKFEPSQRVIISKIKPLEKEAKSVISDVTFISPDKLFAKEKIYFNENLNVIIGGKSSGKSILLYNIAKTLFQDKHNLLKFYNPDTKKEEYKYEFSDNFDFIVQLKSGAAQSVKRLQSDASILTDLKYIPQNYLSELAERKFKKSNELNKLVRDLILEDIDSNLEYNHFITKVKQNDRLREILINNFFDISSSIGELKQQLVALGNRDGINQNIINIKSEIEKLKIEAGLNPEETLRFNALKAENQQLEIQRSNLVNDWQKLRDFNSEFNTQINELISKKNLFINSIQDIELKQVYASRYNQLDLFTETLKEIDRDVLLDSTNQFVNESVIKEKFNSIWIKQNAIIENLKPFNLKVELQVKIDASEKSLSGEEKKLNDILNLEKEISLKEVASNEEFLKIFNLYRESYNEYSDIISKLENRINSLEDENLQIRGIVKFNFNKFKELFIGISNSTSKSYAEYKLFENDNSSSVNIEEMISEKKNIFIRIVKDEYVLRKQTSKPEALKVLLQDHFFDYWEVSSGRDTLYKMSTGKASFIILKLIIGLSKSKAPILIDQPEDNLDNRSITKELVEYLKVKKNERQIILVTHNPNIVVNADAENVIVAHQFGQDSHEPTTDYKFDYTNGPLEESFIDTTETNNILQSMGIREHIAEIVEGGKEAFKQRELRYRFN